MPSTDELSGLLLNLYAAPIRPQLWPVFLTDLTRFLGLPAAAILHQGIALKEYRFEVAIGVDPAATELYGQYYGRFDPFLPRFLEKQEGELAIAEDLCPTSALRKTEFYNDYLRTYDFTLHSAIATSKRPHCVEHVSLYDSLRTPNVGGNSIAAIKLILPHIQSALRLQQRLHGSDLSASNCSAALDSLHLGIVLVDQHARCVFVNKKAETLIREGDGISLSKSRLTTPLSRESVPLTRLIYNAIRVGTGLSTDWHGPVSLSRRTKQPLSISATALSRKAPIVMSETSGEAIAVIFIRDPESDTNSLATVMMSLHGLTAAECRVATLLYRGCSISEAAALNSVSRATIRTQLKSIFAKTGVSRQTQLAQLMAQISGI